MNSDRESHKEVKSHAPNMHCSLMQTFALCVPHNRLKAGLRGGYDLHSTCHLRQQQQPLTRFQEPYNMLIREHALPLNGQASRWNSGELTPVRRIPPISAVLCLLSRSRRTSRSTPGPTDPHWRLRHACTPLRRRPKTATNRCMRCRTQTPSLPQLQRQRPGWHATHWPPASSRRRSSAPSSSADTVLPWKRLTSNGDGELVFAGVPSVGPSIT